MPRMPFHKRIHTRAISSVYGKVEQILLAYPGGMENVDQKWMQDRFGGLFNAFNDRVSFVVMGHFGKDMKHVQAAKQGFEQALSNAHIDPGHHLVFCHTPLAGSLDKKTSEQHSEYIQDPFVVMETEFGTPVLLEPIRQVKEENAYLAEQLAMRAGFLIQPTELRLEGGNILIGDDYALIGANVREANIALAKIYDPAEPDKWLKRQLQQQLGLRYVIWVGQLEPLDITDFHSTGEEKMQPCFHLDLFATLAGKTETGDELILLATLPIDNVQGEPNDAEKQKILKIEAALDDVAAKLSKNPAGNSGPKFKVIRVPIAGKIKATGSKRRLVLYPYLNAQVEIFSGVKRIYLPSFLGMAELEDQLERTLRFDNKFQDVTFIKSAFEEYATNSGSLRCISKVLSRSSH